MHCALCDAPEAASWLYFAGKGKLPGKGRTRVRGQIPLCDHCSEMIHKHLKRALPARLFTTMLLAIVLALAWAAPASPQTRADTVQTELVRLRGFIRAAETQATKALDALLPLTTQPVGPPTVLDWRTGVWDVLAGGYRVALDLTAGKATVAGVTAPVTSTAAGDTLRVRLQVPGYTTGLLEMVHAEGRMIGTVAYDTIVRPASAQREQLLVVPPIVRRGDCTFARYTDGSWGISPNTGACHAALDAYAGPLRFVAREYTP